MSKKSNQSLHVVSFELTRATRSIVYNTAAHHSLITADIYPSKLQWQTDLYTYQAAAPMSIDTYLDDLFGPTGDPGPASLAAADIRQERERDELIASWDQ
jgi:hypothetical protein